MSRKETSGGSISTFSKLVALGAVKLCFLTSDACTATLSRAWAVCRCCSMEHQTCVCVCLCLSLFVSVF